NFSQLGQLRVSIKNDNGIEVSSPNFTFNGKIPDALKKNCDPPQNEKLNCNQVSIPLPSSPGNYTLQLLPTSTTAQQPQPSEAIKFQVAATPPKIVSFTLNGQPPNPAIAVPLRVGQTITVNWQVEGDDTTAKLDPIGDVPITGSQRLPVTPTLSRIALAATNKQGQTIERAFLVQVQLPPSPSPSPTVNPVLPSPAVPLRSR
ncbi:hypothetical protein IQ250_29855, partial [Pseudanabaenaceae cyanobacterium LEGE 13415]|nr:hypothetical protein [Pseudanabaenaceae cyanobacterium LEGE 13415]